MKILKIILKTGFWMITTLSIGIIIVIKWMVDSWAHLTIEELIFHLSVPLSGMSMESVMHFILCYGTLIIGLIAATIALSIFLKKHNKTKWFYLTVPLLFTILMILSVRSFDKKMGLFSYMSAQMIPSKFIADNYTDPDSVELVFP